MKEFDIRSDNYLRPGQAEEIRREVQNLEKSIDLKGPLALENRGAAIRQLKGLRGQLESQSPPELKGKPRDDSIRRERELFDRITPGLLSSEEMRRNPPGAVNHHMAHERRFKADIIEWKNRRLMNHRDSTDPDLCNLERFRPSASRLNLDNAQIPRSSVRSFPSQQYQDNYGEIDWRDRKIAELEAKIAEAGGGERVKFGPEERDRALARVGATPAPVEPQPEEARTEVEG
jgi:hypothetical protein